jgi:serine/threonine-protein kinase
LLAADAASAEIDELAGGWLGAPEEPAPSLVGQAVGPYRLLAELGSGGMGTVYLAERADEQFRQRVALKILRGGTGDGELHRRFRLERQVLARLQHPGIARLYDGGVTEDGRPWFSMEHVDGRALDRFCVEGKLPLARRIALVIQACDAVQHAHRNMIVHRDLKPSNILVTDEGEVRLLDFGIAKLLDAAEASETRLTRTDARAMTPEYASPEQVRGEPVSGASDVYALGVVLYQILTDRRPYSLDALSPSELERVVCETDPPAPSTVVEDGERRRALAGDLDTIVRKALTKEPERRYATVDALAEDLRRHLDGRPVLARPDTASYRVRKFVRRHRWGVAAAVAILASLVAGVAVASWQARAARDQARSATRERDRAQRVTEMLVGLFEAADPGETGGETISARTLLDRGRARLSADVGADAAVHATLALAMGRAYRNLGMYDDAESLLASALRERRSLARDGADPAVGEALNELGGLLFDRGHGTDAAERFREALAIYGADPSADSEALATTHANLGGAYWRLASLDSAVTHLRQAAELWRAAPPGPDNDLALTLGNLGAALMDAGDLVAADSLLREAVEAHRRRSPSGSDDLAKTLNNVGALHWRQGDHAGAELLFREGLDIRERIFGSRHPDVVTARHNLAAVLVKQGKLGEAERMYRDVLALRRETFREPHPSVASALNNLGMVLQDRGNLEEAEALLREALTLKRKVWDGEHPEIAAALHNLAELLRRRGQLQEAESLFREALAMRRSLLGEEHEKTAATARALAALLSETGREEEERALTANLPAPQ